MKRSLVIIFLVSGIMFAFCGFQTSSQCDQNSCRLVAELYAFAISYPDALPNFIENNKDRYVSNGKWQICAELLASQLENSALFSFNPNQIKEKAMDIATEVGAPEFGPKVAESMMETATDMRRLASWLRSISNSVSQIQSGNLYAYQNTEPYLLTTIIWNGAQSLLGLEFTRKLQRMTYEGNLWIVFNFARQVG